jgi:hypothetical protein
MNNKTWRTSQETDRCHHNINFKCSHRNVQQYSANRHNAAPHNNRPQTKLTQPVADVNRADVKFAKSMRNRK